MTTEYERYIRRREYTKQLRSSSLPRNLCPLWHPEPVSMSEYDEVNIGDVGVLKGGDFTRLFSVVVADHGKHNNTRRGVPQGFESLRFDPDTDLFQRPICNAKDGGVWCSTRLTWKRVDPPESHSDYMCYQFQKKKDSDVCYALISPREAIEVAVREDRMDAWKAHMDRNFKQWADLAVPLMENAKAEDLIFVTGYVRTSQWVRLALKKHGTYTFGVDPESYVNAFLKLEDEPITDPEAMQVRGDNPESYFNGVQRRLKENGIEPTISEFPRRHCLFVSGWRLDKGSFVSPRKITAAASPEDLPRDGPERWRGAVLAMDGPATAEDLDPAGTATGRLRSCCVRSASTLRTIIPNDPCAVAFRPTIFNHPTTILPAIVY